MFNINWTKKTRFVINGKAYERLEDVPEQFRSLLKDGDGIPDIAAQGKTTWKIAPVFKITQAQGELLDLNPSVPVAPPGSFRCAADGGERRISWRWISLRAVGAFMFFVLWDGILAAVLYGMSFAKDPPMFALAVPLFLAAVGAGITYALAAYLVNRTSIRMDGTRVSVRHGPLPWPGAKDVLRADIDRVFCETYDRGDDEAGWEPRMTYNVMLRLKGGAALSLASGLHAPEEALFIEQQIRKP